MKHYDIIIIGSGGGTKLRPLADEGKTIAIIEKSELGGTCLNRGCIPSKMLIYPSDLATSAREHAVDLHVHGLENPRIDFKNLIEETQQRISADSNSITPVYEKHENITLYAGHATFIKDKVISVNEQEISADTIYVATGSIPAIPNIDGLSGTPYMTSKDALANSTLPKKMIVIGGGYIAVELGHVYGAAGCDVHFLVRSSMIKAEDKDIRAEFEKDFSNRYNVHFGVSPVKVEYRDKIFFVTLDSGEIMQSDALFVATGVRPMTDGLGLENTGIKTNKSGYIQVDDYLETDVPGVYALGDVVGNYLFRHSVNFEGEYLLGEYKKKNMTHASSFSDSDITHPRSFSLQENEADSTDNMQPSSLVKRRDSEMSLRSDRDSEMSLESENKTPIIYPPVPHAIFSYPQIAGVGVTQDELEKSGNVEGVDYETAIHHYKNSAMGSAMKAEVGFVKLIAEKKSGKILGAHIIGEKSSDIIHMMIVIISADEDVDFMLDKMIFIHPALSEVIRNAARKLKEKLS